MGIKLTWLTPTKLNSFLKEREPERKRKMERKKEIERKREIEREREIIIECETERK